MPYPMGTPVAGSSSPSLAEMVEILKRGVGVEGDYNSMQSIVQRVAQELGDAAEDEPPPTKARSSHSESPESALRLKS